MQWKLFATLAETAGQREIEVNLDGEATFEDALEALFEAHPDLREDVLDEDGEIQSHIRTLHNGADPFRVGDGYETPLDADDELALFPPVSGG